MNIRKELPRFLCVLAPVLVFFFWPMIFDGWGYYYGDYKQQFYPWAWVLTRSLKSFSLPVWVPEIGCGFPLLAEGQSGALYPLNWIQYFLLPFPLSYHTGFVVLFLLAGIFSYLFLRQCALSKSAAAFASVTFLFGSAYAGLFYGPMALRVLAWFPLSLYFIERLIAGTSRRSAAGLALSWGMGFLGGYPQMACYGVLAGAVYAFFRLRGLPRKEKNIFWMSLLMAAALAVGIAAAQIVPTLELAFQSGRAGSGLDFALQKSFNPLNTAALFWPGFGAFFGFDFYIGILPLVLALTALGALKKDGHTAAFFWTAFFFWALAMGRFNPIYGAFLKAFHFYSFRVPSKFIYFSCFFLAALCGKGLDRVLSDDPLGRRHFRALLRTVFVAAVGILFSAWALVRFLGPRILELGQVYVKTSVFGKPGHPLSLETYLVKLQNLMVLANERTNFLDPHVLTAFAIWATLLVSALALKDKWFHKKTFLLIAAGILLFDLHQATQISTGFRGNRLPAEAVRADGTAEFLSSQPGLYRTYEVPGARWMPNANQLFGYSSVGIYTPLAKSTYRDFLDGSGAVDDAMGAAIPQKEYVSSHLKRLGFMNVRYVVSADPLEGVAGLKKIYQLGNDDTVYLNAHVMPRAFWAKPARLDAAAKTAEVFREDLVPDARSIRWVFYGPRKLELEVKSDGSRMLFLSESHDPGWRARVDGKPADIYRVEGIFRGVRLSQGSHHVTFSYKPLSLIVGFILTGLATSLTAVLFRRTG